MLSEPAAMKPLSLRNLIGGFALALACIIAVAPPVAYFFVNYGNQAELLEFRATLNANRLARYIYTHNSLWRFQGVRLIEVIERPEDLEGPVLQQVIDQSGELVINLGDAPAFPSVTATAPIVVDLSKVGEVRVTTTIRPLLAQVSVAGLLSCLLGSAVFFVVRMFPLRVLDRTLKELREALGSLREQNARFDVAINNMPQGLVMFDQDRKLIVCNRKYSELYGLTADLMKPGITQQQILDHRVATGLIAKSEADRYRADRTAKASRHDPTDTILELSDGRTLLVALRPMASGGWVTTHEDITARRQAEAQIAHMARYDALTGLPNRAVFGEELDRALARVQRGERLALLYIDLDHFKRVNDTQGHSVGDELLKSTADRLRGCVRETDFVARLGGDEFAIIQTAIEHASDAAALAMRVAKAIRAPFDLNGHQATVDVSVGISIAPDDATERHQLLKNADMALYGAKDGGRGTYHFYEPDMDARMKAREQLEADLRNALANGEFELYYQPIVNLQTNRVSSCEALLRWHHPGRGLVAPAEFIPLAEESGLMVARGVGVAASVLRRFQLAGRRSRCGQSLARPQIKTGLLAQLGHQRTFEFGPGRIQIGA